MCSEVAERQVVTVSYLLDMCSISRIGERIRVLLSQKTMRRKRERGRDEQLSMGTSCTSAIIHKKYLYREWDFCGSSLEFPLENSTVSTARPLPRGITCVVCVRCRALRGAANFLM